MNARIHKQKGFRRLVNALGHQRAGIRHALANDAAIRQVATAVVALLVVSASLPISVTEHLILAVVTVQVLLLEVVNSAIEATVDRISEERHPLAKEAKDLGSVAVGLSVTLALVCWLVICWPLAAGLASRPGA
jgi:diacylglycerol kinase (ATP)